MGKIRIHMMMSLDGYVAGPNPTIEKPFGDIPDGFLDWVFRLKSFRQHLGMGDDGETGLTDDVMRESQEGVGAHILGRNMFGGGPGPWSTEPPWNGWWGPNPPYHTPTFVVTHHAREPLMMEGGTTFHFVTDGIEAALRRAREAAGDLDVRIGGGGDVANQYLAAGLVDELEVNIVPRVMGGGVRLFEGLEQGHPRFELIRAVAGPEITHVKYRALNRR